MKRYKLLKDTPTLKAGTIFVEEGDNFNDYKELVQVVPYGCLNRPFFAVSEINNFDDWFEEIPEKHERWRGGRGDDYYFINDEGVICHEIDTNDGMDNYRYNVGIYGRTKQELEAKLKYNVARQVLLDDAEGGNFVPGSSNNWYNSYCLCLEEWSTFSSWYYYPGAIYFKSEEALLKSLKEHKDQWEIVRKYEMGE
jgi:hypothetical protein